MGDIVRDIMKLHNHEGPEAADEIERLRAERDEAISGRDTAIRYLVAHAREAGSWQGIAEGKDIVIRQLEAERDRLRDALQHVTLWVEKYANPQAVLPYNTKAARAALGETDRLNDCGGSDSCCQGPCKARY